MSPDWRCPWCLEDVPTIASPCPCCGMGRIADGSCAHRTGAVLDDLFRAGIRLVRRDPWAPMNYLELVDVGGFMAPFAWLHSPLELFSTVPGATRDAQQVPLWQAPRGGWDAYDGPMVGRPRQHDPAR